MIQGTRSCWLHSEPWQLHPCKSSFIKLKKISKRLAHDHN